MLGEEDPEPIGEPISFPADSDNNPEQVKDNQPQISIGKAFLGNLVVSVTVLDPNWPEKDREKVYRHVAFENYGQLQFSSSFSSCSFCKTVVISSPTREVESLPIWPLRLE